VNNAFNFSFVSRNVYHISRRKLKLWTFTAYSYGHWNCILIERIWSLIYIMTFWDFVIVSQKLFHISRRNLILDTFCVLSYCIVNFSLIDLNKSLVHMEKFRNFFISSLFFGFILDWWSWNSKGPCIPYVLVSSFTFQRIIANILGLR
jgi:hypothetical protein